MEGGVTMPLPPPGTFRLYPFAEPPLPAGRYTLTGDVTGLPGPVEPMPAVIDVVAPRYALPPDQILGTFPPAGARGSFTSRLPQVVLRRRTLPWERSPDLASSGTPTPWLALVLLAEGEAELHSDVPVEQCVTSGLTLDVERDVPKGSCIEVPERVVTAVFPTREDLAMLTHIRQVDMRDTELAMGDDDGWMAVVLANRLPQPNTRYLACLINLEGQYNELPEVGDIDLELDYDPLVSIVDLRVVTQTTFGTASTLDHVVMGLPGAQSLTAGGALGIADDTGIGPAAAPATPGSAPGSAVRSAVGVTAPTGSGWAATASGASGGVVATAAVSSDKASAKAAKLALADGFGFPAAVLQERTLRFPVLAYWSFSCEERGDFQYLAEHVTSRLLGHMPDPNVPETPDGDPPPAGGASPPGARPEPTGTRPLPLVAETGHIALDAVTRRGDATQAWFRGPLTPTPVERATTRPDGAARPPLAHHADQLRRVVPDGREDLGTAAAFEIGRLLALSQPGVGSALRQWRQEAFGAARARSATEDAVAAAPDTFREYVARPDPLTDDTPEQLRAEGVGRRAARAVFQLLGEQPELVAPSRPLADLGSAAEELKRLMPEGRDAALLAGLGLDRALDGVNVGEEATVAEALAEAPALVAGKRNLDSDVAVLRQALEAEAARLAEAASAADQIGRPGFKAAGGRR
jgi:hypothetical protein